MNLYLEIPSWIGYAELFIAALIAGLAVFFWCKAVARKEATFPSYSETAITISCSALLAVLAAYATGVIHAIALIGWFLLLLLSGIFDSEEDKHLKEDAPYIYMFLGFIVTGFGTFLYLKTMDFESISLWSTALLVISVGLIFLLEGKVALRKKNSMIA